MGPLATEKLLENTDGVLHRCSLGAAACYLLAMLTAALLMTSSHLKAEPSIVFEPAMANGNGWAAAFLDGQWQNGQQQAGHLGVFAAGPKMGKSATVGGWWNKHHLPFERSVVVAAAVVPGTSATAVAVAVAVAAL